jgi:3-deoxy-D-manno-octulosonic-acid transferase
VFFLYDVLVNLAVALFLVPRELALRLAGRARSADLRERLGRGTRSGFGSPLVVIHAVSVGEMAAAGALIPELARRLPGVSVLLTTGNRDGRVVADRLRERYPAIRAVSLLPWDRRRAICAWLKRLAPDFVIVVETEIWPNLYRECGERSVPLVIVNGRMPEREARRYGLARRFFRQVLSRVRWIDAQTEADRQRFLEIGADPTRVRTSGNLKFDAAADGEESGTGNSTDRLLVAGSTHPSEEEVLLSCLGSLRRRHPSLRLALAPRQVGRARSIAALARRKGFRTAFESECTDEWDVLIVDRIGRLASQYARAEMAVIGGTLADRGGHNPLEACARNCVILAGPSRRSFAEIFDGLEMAGAIVSASGVEPLASAIDELLTDPQRRRVLARRSYEFWCAGRGVAAACAERIVGTRP